MRDTLHSDRALLPITDSRQRKSVNALTKASLEALADTIFNTGGLAIKTAGSPLAKTANTVYGQVGSKLFSLAAGDMAALSGTVTNAAFNVFMFSYDGTTAYTEMGVEGATLAAVEFPPIQKGRAVLGFVIINPTGTGNFVGGTTDLDDATVVPGAIYVNTPFPFNPHIKG